MCQHIHNATPSVNDLDRPEPYSEDVNHAIGRYSELRDHPELQQWVEHGAEVAVASPEDLGERTPKKRGSKAGKLRVSKR